MKSTTLLPHNDLQNKNFQAAVMQKIAQLNDSSDWS